MDQVLKDTLIASMKHAKTPEAKDDAMIQAMIAMCECQYKTAQRVKSMPFVFLGVVLGSSGGAGALIANWHYITSLFP